MLDLEPLGDKVIVSRIDEDAEMKRGLHIPEIAQTKSSKGRVVAVGEGRLIGDKVVPLPLEIGDVVLFSKYGATRAGAGICGSHQPHWRHEPLQRAELPHCLGTERYQSRLRRG